MCLVRLEVTALISVKNRFQNQCPISTGPTVPHGTTSSLYYAAGVSGVRKIKLMF